MKVIRYLAVLLSLSVVLMLQGCGDETGGALTMTALTKVDNGDGTYAVSATITYVPPTGKSAEGVEVNIAITDLLGNVVNPYTHKFLSGSNVHIITVDPVYQLPITNNVRISASIGSMNVSGGVSIPAINAISASPINFSIAEAIGSTKQTTISGGSAPYTLITPTPVDGVLNLSLSDNTLTVIYASATTVSFLSTNIQIRDNLGTIYSIPVGYYK